MSLFRDRSHAGKRLANAVRDQLTLPRPLVLGLPRGGVPVAYEVARALSAPLDVFIVRKLGVPGQEELAMGAIASGGIRIVNDDVVEMLQLSDAVIDAAAAIEQEELERRETTYRHGRAGYDLAQHDVLLIDDGLATGASMLAAVTAVREQRPSSLTIAVPVAAPDVCRTLGKRVDAIVCLATPDPLYGVGFWYDDFEQTSDDEVRRLLDRARHWQHAA